MVIGGLAFVALTYLPTASAAATVASPEPALSGESS
jgi:hypothetical protein